MPDQCTPSPVARTCTKCGETKPVAEFSRDASRRDGLCTRCKPCRSADRRAWRQANEERLHAQRQANETPPFIARTCTGCGETKPSTEFYREAGSRDGLRKRCKPCCSVMFEKWKQVNQEHLHEQQRAYRLATQKHRAAVDKVRRQSKPEYFSQKRAAYYKANRERLIAYAKEQGRVWRLANPEKVSLIARAHKVIYSAIKRGELTRPTLCEACGHERQIQAAHWDYARPLDVRWLCRPCHSTWDAVDPKIRKHQ